MTTPEPTARVGLIGFGPILVRAIEALKGLSSVVLAVVADTAQSEGARLARSLRIPVVGNPTDVFRTDADVILQLNGEPRQYDRLLAVKPSRVEVMGARGAGLLIDLLRRDDGRPTGRADPPKTLIVVAASEPQLHEYLKAGFAGVPGVEVLVDRRRRERRQRIRGQATERRAADRRQQPALDEALRTRGFAIIREAPKGIRA